MLSRSRIFVRPFSNLCKPEKHPDCKKAANQAEYKPPSEECIYGPSGYYPYHQGGYKKYKNLALFVCLPLVCMSAYHVFSNPHEPERPPFIKYEYLRRRTKKFFWSGGTDRSFFHNPKLNALPDGYEDDEEGGGGE